MSSYAKWKPVPSCNQQGHYVCVTLAFQTYVSKDQNHTSKAPINETQHTGDDGAAHHAVLGHRHEVVLRDAPRGIGVLQAELVAVLRIALQITELRLAHRHRLCHLLPTRARAVVQAGDGQVRHAGGVLDAFALA